MRTLMLLVLVAGTPAVAIADGGDGAWMAVDVDLLRSQGFRRDGEVLRPLASVLALPADAAQGLLVEAEEADEFHGQVRRDGAAKLSYVANCRVLRCRVQFPEKGNRAVVWARLRHGQDDTAIQVDWGSSPTGWGTFTWQSRAAYQQRQLDADKENAKNATAWRWERISPPDWRRDGGVWRFEAKWTGSWNRRGCPDIDQLLIVPGDGGPDAVQHVTERVPVREHVVYSAPLKYAAAAKLLGAALRGPADGAVVEASLDDGKTWADPAAPSDRRPASILLRARFPQGAAATAAIRGFDVKLALDEPLRLSAGTLTIDFDRTRCGVVRIADVGGDPRTLAAPVEAIPLFTLELKKRGQPWPNPRKIVVPDAASLMQAVAGERGGADLSFKLLDGAILAAVRVERMPGGAGGGGGGEKLVWRLELDNKSEWDILTCAFPRFAGVCVGDTGTDDWFVSTSRYGPWPAAIPPEDRPYPGWGALGWCDLHDAKAGLSLAVREHLEGQTTFRLRPDYALRQTAESSLLEAVREHCVAAGEKKSFSYTMLAHRGDWHAAADDYRVDFEKTFGRPDHWPEWARDSNGWLAYNAHLSDRTFKWPMLLDTFEQARRLGLSHVQLWGQFGSSSCSSFFWPSPRYGTIDEFAAVTREIRRRGGHVGGYFLYNEFNRFNLIDAKTHDGYLPRSAYPTSVPEFGIETFKRGMLVTDPAGALTGWPANDAEMKSLTDALAGLHQKGQVSVWSPGATWEVLSRDPAWIDWLTRWTCELYAKQWHCDTPYLDVLGCKNQRSFDLRRNEHGHVLGSGEMHLARALFEAGRKIDPHFLLLAEGKSELVTRWAAGMTSSSHPGWIDLDAHRYTHPEHILYFGSQNGGYTQNLHNALRAFLYGARFDLLEIGDVRRVRQVVTLRQAFLRYVTRATYRDTVGLAFSGDGVEARRFDRVGSDSRAMTICVINPNEVRDGKLTVDLGLLGADGLQAIWLDSDGRATHVHVAASARFETAVPSSIASALLLVGRVAPGEPRPAQIVATVAPGGARTTGWVATVVGAAPATATLEGLGGKAEIALSGAVGVTRIDRVWPTTQLDNGGDVTLSVGGQTAARAFCWPIVEDGSFETFPSPPAAGQPFHGRRFVQLPPAKGWQGVFKLLNVQPGAKYRFTVMGRRSGDKGTIYGLVRFRSQSQGWQYGALNFPPGRFNEWVRLQCELAAPADLVEADLYLYNSDSQETVDYDALRAEQP